MAEQIKIRGVVSAPPELMTPDVLRVEVMTLGDVVLGCYVEVEEVQWVGRVMTGGVREIAAALSVGQELVIEARDAQGHTESDGIVAIRAGDVELL